MLNNQAQRIEVKIPNIILDFINQLFEIEKKATSIKEENSIYRNINKIKMILEEDLFKDNSKKLIGFSFHNPIGERYNETRTDCEASIAGISVDNLIIVEVIKPIIYCNMINGDKPIKIIVQKAVVVVKSKIII